MLLIYCSVCARPLEDSIPGEQMHHAGLAGACVQRRVPGGRQRGIVSAARAEGEGGGPLVMAGPRMGPNGLQLRHVWKWHLPHRRLRG